jgi:hypothetical protein
LASDLSYPVLDFHDELHSPVIWYCRGCGLHRLSAGDISALFGMNIQARPPGVRLLDFGIFAVFVPFVLICRHDFGSRPSWQQISAGLPRWVVVRGALVCAYSLINFMLFAVGTGGGSPAIRDGKYLLLDHGKVIREISASEYSAFKLNEVRGSTGHLIVFYFVPAAYLLGWKSNHSCK